LSIPHTGRLVAEIDGQRCTFDGNHWKCPLAELAAMLNEATITQPKQHYSVEGVAKGVFYHLGLESRARILEFQLDE
jgi:hypothetical protein